MQVFTKSGIGYATKKHLESAIGLRREGEGVSFSPPKQPTEPCNGDAD